LIPKTEERTRETCGALSLMHFIFALLNKKTKNAFISMKES